MNNKIKTKYISFILIIFILICGFSIYVYNKKINVLTDEVYKNKKFVFENEELEKFNSSVEQNKKIIQDISKKIDSLYVPKDNPVVFIEKIENEAKNNNLEISISGVSLEKASDEKKKDNFNYGNLKMVINASGQFQDVTNFLQKVETMPYILTIGGLKMEEGSEEIKKEEEVVLRKKWTINFALNVITN